MNIAILLFEDFETLDVFGPVEIFGRIKDQYVINFYSESGGLVTNNHGVAIQTEKLEIIKNDVGIFLIPGGYGNRREVNNLQLIDKIKEISSVSTFVLTVCTGTALLAKTGLLDGKKATSNKRAFDWVITHGEKVNWIRKARWTKDGKFYTSAGVSAGMDMSLGFLSDIHGVDFARKIAYEMEYNWIENMEEDLFHEQSGFL
jgi:putative intracellular protease/amidase